MSLILRSSHGFIDTVEVFAQEEIPSELYKPVNDLLSYSYMPGLEGVEDPLDLILHRGIPTMSVIGLFQGVPVGYMALSGAANFYNYSENQVERLLFNLAIATSPQGKGIATSMLETFIPQIHGKNKRLSRIAIKSGFSPERAKKVLENPIMLMNTRINGLARAFAQTLLKQGYSYESNAAKTALDPLNQVSLERKAESGQISFIRGASGILRLGGNNIIPIRKDGTVTYNVPDYQIAKETLLQLVGYGGETIATDPENLIRMRGHNILTHARLIGYLTRGLLAGIEPNMHERRSVQEELRVVMEKPIQVIQKKPNT
jgi:hypothetical protein